MSSLTSSLILGTGLNAHALVLICHLFLSASLFRPFPSFFVSYCHFKFCSVIYCCHFLLSLLCYDSFPHIRRFAFLSSVLICPVYALFCVSYRYCYPFTSFLFLFLYLDSIFSETTSVILYRKPDIARLPLIHQSYVEFIGRLEISSSSSLSDRSRSSAHVILFDI